MQASKTSRSVISVSTRFDERADRVIVVVSDTGPGISPVHMAKIFEPHFTTKAEGHGFGLSTSHRILANHGGSITVDSPPGNGAVFTLSLPVHRSGTWS